LDKAGVLFCHIMPADDAVKMAAELPGESLREAIRGEELWTV